MGKGLVKLFLMGFLVLANVSIVLAYIDPGTGGYLASSVWSSIIWIFAAVVSFLGVFFRKYLIIPVKSVWKKHRKVLVSLIVLILVLIPVKFLVGNITGNVVFDESLSGVQVYDKYKVYEGYNLFDGKLIDMDGNVVKKWDFVNLGTLYNGDYFAQEYFESERWGRFDFDGNPIWIHSFPIHHEITISPDNTIYTITKEVHTYNGREVEFGVIVEFDLDGNELSRWSTWDNLEYLKSFHRPLELERAPGFLVPEDHRKNTSIWGGNYDYYHLNSVSFVPKNKLEGVHRAFNEGNLIVSFRHGSMVFILDKDTKEVLWRAIYDQVEGNLEGQHSPVMLENGNIVIFDNGRYREWSRIIELNPITLDIVWEYKADDFYTLSQGYVQVLSNGNFLVTESEKGRVFELTRDKEIVWEYYHPEVQNETNSNSPEHYGERQWIYRMIRYPKGVI